MDDKELLDESFLSEIEKNILPNGEPGGIGSLPEISPRGQVLPRINNGVDQPQGIFKDVPQGTGTGGIQNEGIRAEVSLERFCRTNSQGVVSCLPGLSLNIPLRIDFTQDQQGQDQHGMTLTPGRVGARVARSYASGPGLNEARNNSVSPNFRYPSAESFDNRPGLKVSDEHHSGASSVSSHDRKRIIELGDSQFSGRIDSISRDGLPLISPRGDKSRASSASSAASSAASSVGSAASSIGSAASRGKKRLANLRGEAIFSASPGSVDFDPDMYVGVIRIDLQNRGRIKVNDAVGANISKHASKGKGEDGEQIPGRVILQNSTKDSKGRIVHKYTGVYLDGSKDVMDEVYLKHHMDMYSRASEKGLKPLIVEML